MTDCIGCALKNIQREEQDASMQRMRSQFINTLITLKVMVESDEIDEALELLTELTEGE